MAETRPAQSQYALVRRARRMGRILAETYPDAHCELKFKGPYELLVATILSAQCTDVRVNQVTPAVFARYPNPAAMAQADRNELEGLIASTGFFRNKATSLLGMSAKLVSDYGGQVPRRMEQLVTLPGVGRKTANVVLGNAFGVPGITVDTHFGRLSRRFGWTSSTDPDQVESDVSALFPRRDWTVLSHRVIWHGRRVCNARRPACGACPLALLCPAFGTGEVDPQLAARLVRSAPERTSDSAEPDNAEPDNAEPDNAEPDNAEVDNAEGGLTKSPDARSEQVDRVPGRPVMTHQGHTQAHVLSPSGTPL